MDAPRIGVAVGEGTSSKDALKWALDKENLRRGDTLHLLHVCSPGPVGHEHANEAALRKFRQKRDENVEKLISVYKHVCDKKEVKTEVHIGQCQLVRQGLVELVFEFSITRISIGCTEPQVISRFSSTGLKLLNATYVSRHTGDVCKVVRVQRTRNGIDAVELGIQKPPDVHRIRSQNNSFNSNGLERHHSQRESMYDHKARAAIGSRASSFTNRTSNERELIDSLPQSGRDKAAESERQLLDAVKEYKRQTDALMDNYKRDAESAWNQARDERKRREELQERIEELQKRKYREYSYEELESATDNFHEGNKVGEGGYGPVFKGKLLHTPVAIKRLARADVYAWQQFESEVDLLSNVHHPHLVMLMGACPESGCIVYEYMSNGSLEDRLTRKGGTPPLPWNVRFRICAEVATALLFLHTRAVPIVHRDMKPGNILLDQNYVSKIGDVGIAKLVPNSAFTSRTNHTESSVLKGTMAYMDPEYPRTGVVTCQSDVYALGIVMLQILTGFAAMEVVDIVEDALEKNELHQLLDKEAGEWPLEEATSLAKISLQCAEPKKRHRPDLEKEVLPILERLRGCSSDRVEEMADASSSSSMPSAPSSSHSSMSSSFLC